MTNSQAINGNQIGADQVQAMLCESLGNLLDLFDQAPALAAFNDWACVKQARGLMAGLGDRPVTVARPFYDANGVLQS